MLPCWARDVAFWRSRVRCEPSPVSSSFPCLRCFAWVVFQMAAQKFVPFAFLCQPQTSSDFCQHFHLVAFLDSVFFVVSTLRLLLGFAEWHGWCCIQEHACPSASGVPFAFVCQLCCLRAFTEQFDHDCCDPWSDPFRGRRCGASFLYLSQECTQRGGVFVFAQYPIVPSWCHECLVFFLFLFRFQAVVVRSCGPFAPQYYVLLFPSLRIVFQVVYIVRKAFCRIFRRLAFLILCSLPRGR